MPIFLEDQVSPEMRDLMDVVRALPRPRQLRLDIWYVAFLAFWSIATPLIFAGLFNAILTRHPDIYWTVFIVVFGLCGPIAYEFFLLKTLYVLPRYRKLFANGEVQLARVTKMRQQKRGSRVWYEFTDLSGRVVKGSSWDKLRNNYVGTPIPILFDANKPEHSVSLFGPIWSIKLPSGATTAQFPWISLKRR